MRRKKRGTPVRAKLPATPNNDPLLLDEFSQQDLRAWKRNSELLHQYRVRHFYELESLRALHRGELVEALRAVPSYSQTLSGWTRIVSYRYAMTPLSAAGSLRHGGRFNIGDDLDADRFPSFPALYIAENYNTAYAERFGAPPSKSTALQPHELSLRDTKSFLSGSLKGRIKGLFDLRDQKHLRNYTKIISQFQITRELRDLAMALGFDGPLLPGTPKTLHMRLMGNWMDMPIQYGLPSNSQVFARFLRGAGFEGVLYRCKRRINLRP